MLNEDITSSAPKNSGIDITPVGVSITYSNLADENQYKMFSSNHPIANFNRPAELYVTDSVNSTPMDIEVTEETVMAFRLPDASLLDIMLTE